MNQIQPSAIPLFGIRSNNITFKEMPSLYLAKRAWCYGDNCTGTWAWARWVLFVLLILGLVLVVLSALRVNKRRSQEGRQPIMGTAWITPPSYRQSETQNPPYVPQYTAQTNDNDMGYYDGQGQFHPNPKLREAYGDSGVPLTTLVPDSTGQPSTNIPVHETYENNDFQRDFSRYYGVPANGAAAPQTSSPAPEYTADSPNVGTSSSSIEYQRPQSPPPARLKQ